MTGPSLLSFSNLSCYSEKNAPLFRDISGSVAPGKALLIQGPNGSGKTTLLRCILQEQKYFTGNVSLQILKREISFLPQLQNISFHIPVTLGDILEVSYKGFNGCLVEEIGLLDQSQLHLGWNTASGGERKRTLLTRALMQRPKLLILDEPFNHLDTATLSKVNETLLSRLTDKEAPIGLILVSHEKALQSQLQLKEVPVETIILGAS